MAVRSLTPDINIVPGLVNVYLLDTADGLVAVDTGFPNSAPKILAAVQALGRSPSDLRHILLTHAHADHIGSAAALKRATGATVWAHPVDAPIIQAGTGFRPVSASPGLRNRILTRMLMGWVTQVEPVQVDRLLEDGESPAFAPDMTAIHSPGHCAGQIALLWKRGPGVLFTADTCVNRGGMTLPIATEDQDLALRSLRRLADRKFEMICFMHGKPIMTDGQRAFRRTWASDATRSV